MKIIKFWEYQKEYKFLKKKGLIKKIDRSLQSGEIFYGNSLKKFENKFLKFNKSKYGLAVKSGTDALIVSLIAAGVKQGDQVITVSLTAIPTISAIVTIGAIPVFVDIKDNCLIDEFEIEKKITKKTKAIIPVHLYGNVCNMQKITKIANKFKIKIIEDCAQSLGARYQNKLVGNFGDFGCFSFYPTKVLGAYGDGGFIVCKNKKDLAQMKQLCFYGLETSNIKHKKYKSYYSNIHGINSRIDNIQATILSFKLNFLSFWIKRRQKIAQVYSKKLFNQKKINKDHVFHLYVLRTNLRDKLKKYLHSVGILTGIHYENPTHIMKPYLKYFNKKKDSLNKSKKISKEIISLPLHPFISNKEIFKIISEIKKFNKMNLNEIKQTF